jgi:hypothetical protein
MTASRPSDTPEWLDQFTTAIMARIAELIRDIPGGSDEERAALATTVVAEIRSVACHS